MDDFASHDCTPHLVFQAADLDDERATAKRLKQLADELESERQHSMALMTAVAESASQALATKKSFVRYTSHEIRTPLMVARMSLGLIADKIAG